jgi:uncharacterized protein (TIGR02265 family)
VGGPKRQRCRAYDVARVVGGKRKICGSAPKPWHSAAMPTSERVVFSHTVDSLLERCASGLTDAQWAPLGALGVARTHRLPAYEFELWCKIIEYIAHATYPDLPIGDAEYAIGREFVERYAETFVGRALFAMLRLIGAVRTIDRLSRSFRTGTNFTTIDIREQTETSCLLDFNIVEPRARLTQGILARGLEVAGIKGVVVTLESLQGERAVYRLAWTR